MIIKFFTVNKRENSTMQPSGTGYEYDCKLKESTSVVKPDILINFKDQEDPQVHLYNYAYIPSFNRYYFISEQRCVRGLLWEYSLTCDILATYKGVISASELYLLRCSGTYDGAVVDSYYPIKTTYTTSVQTVQTPWLHSSSDDVDKNDGCYILGIVSKPGTSTVGFIGSVKYVVVNQANLTTILNYLMDAGNITNQGITIDGVTAEAAKSIIDPLQFIKSCQWTPLMYSQFESTEQTGGLVIWSWTVPSVSYKTIPTNPAYIKQSVSFPVIPRHPLASSRGAYLNTSPYTKMFVLIPPFGALELDTTLAANSSQLICQIIYDLVTGDAIMNMHYGSLTGPCPVRLKTQVSVPIQLTQVYNDYINAAGGVVGGALGVLGSVLTGNIGGAIMGGISAIGSAVDAMRPVQSSLGGNGGFSDLYGKAQLYAVFYDVPAEDRSHVGRPLCQTVQMSQLASGTYCLAMDGDLPISGTAGEQQTLKEYLESGFYYE